MIPFYQIASISDITCTIIVVTIKLLRNVYTVTRLLGIKRQNFVLNVGLTQLLYK
jgi:hypothetical protein